MADMKAFSSGVHGIDGGDGHNQWPEEYYLAKTRSFDAVVLDLMLPLRDGIQVLHDLRSAGFGVPILILTARDSIDDRVAGLDAGADDYLVKPFAFAELLAAASWSIHGHLCRASNNGNRTVPLAA